jgi:hypothetical protein
MTNQTYVLTKVTTVGIDINWLGIGIGTIVLGVLIAVYLLVSRGESD